MTLTQTRSLMPVLGHGMVSARVGGARQGGVGSIHGNLRLLSRDRTQTRALGGEMGRCDCCVALLWCRPSVPGKADWIV